MDEALAVPDERPRPVPAFQSQPPHPSPAGAGPSRYKRSNVA